MTMLPPTTNSRATVVMRLAANWLLDQGDTPANVTFILHALQLLTHRRKANLLRSLRSLMRKEQQRREQAEDYERKHPPCRACWSGRTDRPNYADPHCRVCGR